jgi:Zn-finger protein
MKSREVIRAWRCDRCERVSVHSNAECTCIIRHLMTEARGAQHRRDHWKPLFERLTVTMESANRG